MIVHTQAIILRVIDYQESSKILTVLSKEHGKIALIAKGAKKPKNKLSGILEIGAVLDVVYYYKSSRGVQTLTEASVFYSTSSFRKDFQRAAVLYSTLELLSQLVHEHEVNQPIFEFAVNFIEWLGDSKETYPSVFAYVQLRLAEITGIGLVSALSVIPEISYLNISSGNISEQSEDELSYKLTPAQTRFLIIAMSGKSKNIFKTGLENGELKQLVHHLDVYFKYHIEGYQERRSDSIFEQML
ncbi:MAG TPA: DNA repair protein RecO [Gracilimonas sp.]|uniref:DNA repair protein RecO n=1 Tax=Gracilimonas sp. TaxID=1974203 RepID=UPI002D9836DD|nr:DNA repair protein RecO [Gracilimonas sp.]